MAAKKETQIARMRRESVDEKVDIQMTPMVDCVFQLLIFFMLACRFRTTEGKINAFLPKNRGLGIESTPHITIQEVRVKLLWVERNSNRETKDPENGRVALKIEDRYFRYVQGGPNNTELIPDYDELFRVLENARDKFTPSPNSNYKALPVIIDARRLVPFQHVVHTLNTCIRANIKDVTFAAPETPF
ncbi:MAG: biopolymer transporter ExbD [Planctomycetota bacterium]